MHKRIEVRRGALNESQLVEWWRTQTQSDTTIVVRHAVEPPTPKDRVLELTQQVIERHEALRSTVELDDNGLPCQVVWSPGEPIVPAFEIVGEPTEEQLVHIYGKEFPRGPAPVSMCLAVDERGFVLELFLVASHVFLDGAGIKIIQRELAALLTDSTALPHPAPQLLDAAVGTDAARSPRHERRSADYWAEKYRSTPSSLFPANDHRPSDIVSGLMESTSGPRLFAAAARRYQCSPAVLYLGLVHIVLSVISGHGVVPVNMHFRGRGPNEDGVVGCFHRILLTTVDLSDRPPLSEAIQRFAREQLRTLKYSQARWGTVSEIHHQEIRRRGAAIAPGSTVNFNLTPQYLEWARADSESGLQSSVPEVSVELTPSQSVNGNPEGLDAYLYVTLSPGMFRVGAGFGRSTLRENEMNAILREPELILTDSLGRDDVPFSEISDRMTSRNSLEPRDAVWVGGCLFDRARAESALALHPDVVSALVTCEGERESATVRAFVETRTPSLTPADLRLHFLAHLSQHTPIACPAEFLLTSASPRDRHDVRSWQRLEFFAHGDGVDLPPATPTSASEKALVAVAEMFNEAEFRDVSSTYLDTGSLAVVPAMLRELAHLGYSGLRPEDFTRPLPLSFLADALTVGPGEEPRQR